MCGLSVDSGDESVVGTWRRSRKGRSPSWFGSSMVNCICGSCELMCCNICWLCFASWMTKVSSTYLTHRWGGCRVELRDLTSNSSINGLEISGVIENPWQHHGPVHNTYLGRGSMCFLRQYSRSVTICCMDMLVLCGSSESCCNFCLTMSMEGSMGTEVKRALTS